MLSNWCSTYWSQDWRKHRPIACDGFVFKTTIKQMSQEMSTILQSCCKGINFLFTTPATEPSEFTVVISLCPWSPRGRQQFSSVIRKALWAELSVDRSHAVKFRLAGFGWTIFLLLWVRRSSRTGRLIGQATSISNSWGNQCCLGQFGAIRMILQRKSFMRLRIFGTNWISGNANAYMLCQAIDRASNANAWGWGC